MRILLCTEVEDQFSSYMDGSLSGAAMVELQEHMRHCRECTASFAAWQATLRSLSCLGPAKVPPMLGLQLRVAISRERSRTWSGRLELLRLRWENTIGPFAMRASAGLATAVLMVGTFALLVGTLAAPQPAAARSQPAIPATPPRFLYVSQPQGFSPSLTMNGSAVLRVYVDASGHVYDYRVISGSVTAANRAAIADEMLWSVFEPAQAFGESVQGSLLLSLSGVSVSG
jgi:anti-sigma factor RsiW